MNCPDNFNIAPKLLAVIIDRSETGKLEDILREKHVHLHYMFHGMGTARSETLKAFGLSGSEKIVCVCMEPEIKARRLLTSVTERMELSHPGNGIAFLIPISGVSMAILSEFTKEVEEQKERWPEYMEQEALSIPQETRFELVVAIVDQGFSENVMEQAHHSGIRGGTIINARRTEIENAVKFFGISLQTEKEIVVMLISKSQKKELMQSIIKSCGMKTEAHGLVISLPVESCAGIDFDTEDSKVI